MTDEEKEKQAKKKLDELYEAVKRVKEELKPFQELKEVQLCLKPTEHERREEVVRRLNDLFESIRNIVEQFTVSGNEPPSSAQCVPTTGTLPRF